MHLWFVFQAALRHTETLSGWFDNEVGASESGSFNFVISWYFPVCYYSVSGSNCPPSITQTLSVGQNRQDSGGDGFERKSLCFFPGGEVDWNHILEPN